ncbi:M56 family metallopeptidase [Undibacterium pigrum]|uniref:TonB family protein n=1 Tax=Undibacterium pigrum TaxID=401470 RepID=A0A318JF92_9BURK|nr:M56 family metallopeptidase [Undibacterium pigrum]PXX47187.1 TonB family protein [Undibacterium pigrum]
MSQFFQHAANALGWALLHFVWQGLLIAFLLAVLLSFVASAHARTRYAAAYIALLTCISLPAKEFFLRMSEKYTGKEISVLNEIPVQLGLDSSSVWLNLLSWLDIHMNDIVVAWMICVAVLVIRMCMGLLWVAAYTHPKRSKADTFWQTRVDQMSQQFHIRSRVICRVVEDLDGPITAGIVRPVILLPTAMLTGMPVNLLEMLLAHEMGHIKRHDYLLNLIQTVIETLLFYHPAVWWISKQIRIEREEIADDIAARVTGEPRRLALALSELANFQFTTPQLAQAAHGGNLMSRIKRLLQPEVRNVSARGILGLIGVAATTVVYAGQALTSLPATGVTESAASIQTTSNVSLPQQVNAKYLQQEKVSNPVPVSGPFQKQDAKLALLQPKPKSINKIPAKSVSDIESQDAAADKSMETIQDVNNLDAEKTPETKKLEQTDVAIAKPKFSYDFSACYPAYPRRSLRNKQTGSTSLLFKVGADGIIDRVSIASSSGYSELDNAATHAFQGCKVSPMQVDGVAVAKHVSIKFIWRLE